ncbi:MAG: hypothetical protein JWR83_378 [Aeromicrobium sp.]|nr:hypothetical protein [Aeromicrobium sp.]
MTNFVRATCAMTFNSSHESPSSIGVERGDVLPADHWAVRQCTKVGAFEDVQLDYDAEDAARSLVGVRAEISSLELRAGGRALHANDVTRVDNLRNRAANLTATVTESIERRERILRAADNPNALERGADMTTAAGRMANRSTPASPGSRTRDLARSVVDAAVRSGELPSHGAENVEMLLSDGPIHEQGVSARWAIATGDPAYRTAFAKMAADPDKGHMMWTPEEHRAYQAVQSFQSEIRAMAIGSGDTGGFMVPLTLDPAILLTNDGSINPLRRISRTVRTATNAWQGVTSAGVTAEWKAEAVEMADASPTVDDPSIPVHKGDAFLPYSYEVGMDAVNFLAEMQKLLVDAADQLQATAFTTGSGAGQPKGIVTALAGTASEVAVAVTAAFMVEDVYKLIEAVPPRFRDRARWMSNLTIMNMIDQFETGNGAKVFPDLGKDKLMRRSIHENSNMDGSWNAAATANNRVLIVGDFSNFIIVDRIGSTLEFIPNLVGANRRPTGQRGAVLWFRTGSDVVIPQAFRMLNIPTAA